MKVALIGYGYWGKKIFSTLTDFFSKNNIIIVDKITNKNNINDVLTDKSVKYCFIATPEETHYEIAKRCLLNNKNIFVEKPLCLDKEQAKELIKISQKNSLRLFVDYIFLYDPYVEKIQQLLSTKSIGDLKQINSTRYSININKPNISVFDDLAIHDIYLSRFFFNKKITTVVAGNIINKEKAQQASAHYFFGDETLSADYCWNKLSPQRIMTFSGSNGALVWDKAENDLLLFQDKQLKEKISIEQKKSPLYLAINDFLSNKKIKTTQPYSVDVAWLEKLRRH